MMALEAQPFDACVDNKQGLTDCLPLCLNTPVSYYCISLELSETQLGDTGYWVFGIGVSQKSAQILCVFV
jgi:hypothetical protein